MTTNKRHRIVTSCVLLLLAAMTVADSPGPNEPTVSVDDGTNLSVVDEIVVVEQRSISQLRVELDKADDRVFSLYNDRNSDNSLDMICKKETRIGSQIKYRVCKSLYHRQLESEAASDFLEGADVSTSAGTPTGHYDEVRSNMASLMKEYPELAEAVLHRATLRKKIAELKENK